MWLLARLGLVRLGRIGLGLARIGFGLARLRRVALRLVGLCLSEGGA
jgi:hypothetical protein